jgi:hypothetical protein
MGIAQHIIEIEQNYEVKRLLFANNMRIRQMILLGLAAAMALATLAPIVVLAA